MGKIRWILWGSIVGIVMTALFSSILWLYSQKKDPLVATIGDEKLTQTQFNQEMKRLYGKEVLNDVKSEIRRELALSQVNPLPKVLEQIKKEMGVEIIDPALK
ncbi:hypothetical protein [Tepidibacillus marianensis]|uniref:hypothetical protein n=1 Tax=Tepidibacillus marianensis TaxID=3131995 RepID=UPI0030CE1B89